MKRLLARQRRKKATKRFCKAIRDLFESDPALCLRAISRGLHEAELDELVVRCGVVLPAKESERPERFKQRLRAEIIGVLVTVEV